MGRGKIEIWLKQCRQEEYDTMTRMSVLSVSGTSGCVNLGRRCRLVINAGGIGACGVAHKAPSMTR